MTRVEFVCPACGAQVPAPPSLAGHSAPCPRCSQFIGHWPLPAGDEYEPAELPRDPGSVATTNVVSAASAADQGADIFAPLAQFGVILFALFGLMGCLAVFVKGRENAEKIEAEMSQLEQAEQAAVFGLERPGFEPAQAKLAKKMARITLEKDTSQRQQAIGNIVFATLFVCVSLGACAYYAARPASPLQRRVMLSAVAGSGFAILGAIASQVAPLWTNGAFGSGVGPFEPYQLTLLAGHTLLCGLIGILLGASASAFKARAGV